MPTVLISHRSSDSAQAQRLAGAIADAGHQVHLDVLDLKIGMSITEWMNSSLGDAKYIVLCYSPSGVDSPWMSREWLSSLARQLNGDNIKILPVLLSGGRPPPILADLKYADVAASWDDGVRALLRAIC